MTGLFERDYLTSLGFVSVGGFLEVYTFVTRGDFFGSGQTVAGAAFSDSGALLRFWITDFNQIEGTPAALPAFSAVLWTDHNDHRDQNICNPHSWH